MPDQHALLAPSAAKRWMTCAPSARAEAAAGTDGSSSFAEEGTIAHAAAEWILKYLRDTGALVCPPFEAIKALCAESPDMTVLQADADRKGFDFNEIVETVYERYVTLVYANYVSLMACGEDATLFVEARLELSSFIPGGFGSSDAVITTDSDLYVYDLKYGKGVKVDAPHNPQMMCYAIGALCGPAELLTVNNVRMFIVQPRLSHVSGWEIPANDLLTWGRDVLRPAAQKAYEGAGDYAPGEHCKFCRAAPRCRALADLAKTTVTRFGQTDMLSNEELAEALELTATVTSWARRVETEALDVIRGGGEVPGWKIVEGRSLRTINDQDAAIKALQDAGFSEETYLKPKELRTITELERVLRKKGFQELLGQYVVKPQGKPTLARASDPRPVFSTADDFKINS